jgi:hypothetical protein
MADDLSKAFEQRVRAIVQPLLDDAVDRVTRALLGVSGGMMPAARRGRPAGGSTGASTGTGGSKVACNVAGCARPVRSKGYCAAHYQSARKYGWPMPAPKGFKAPVRKRGRPPKNRGEKAA